MKNALAWHNSRPIFQGDYLTFSGEYSGQVDRREGDKLILIDSEGVEFYAELNQHQCFKYPSDWSKE